MTKAIEMKKGVVFGNKAEKLQNLLLVWLLTTKD